MPPEAAFDPEHHEVRPVVPGIVAARVEGCGQRRSSADAPFESGAEAPERTDVTFFDFTEGAGKSRKRENKVAGKRTAGIDFWARFRFSCPFRLTHSGDSLASLECP